MITLLTIAITGFYNPDIASKLLPQCNNVIGGIIWGQDINQNVTVTQLTENLSSLVNNFCNISKLPSTYIVCSQVIVNNDKIHPDMQVTIFYVISCVFILLETFALIISSIILNNVCDNSHEYPVLS